MDSYSLFLGCIIDNDLKTQLSARPETILHLYITDQPSDYLCRLEWADQELLGKYLGNQIDSNSLDLVSDHILSLLKCLVPDSLYPKEQLQLMVVPNKSTMFNF